ncbi:hypothetical protein FZI85_25250 [Mycobacterium sp. CBMA293]|uniref:hypothetical protein n=1 Tax=unclassified Mycolicibacterium TaxID=2636767 RepID=UPI0012DD57CF|nr:MULTISPECIES: hypothetical protein [unclassified Mycolicibacterium]MUL47622.1 hypothetical protein [Mycolicibacterium sp. CBMA 360]MUL61860.1 hypothetical protein [Mycolicibacterium sp. CBMA 335]MUL68933.1 hypothetical protein [Mycolicibacterium sp. CBMA 311]MUL92850.1 hypothetical protein [Mycolicibacterium sp. CBMA 230]MUM08707.1 hypothetical protein [Mycolicibacterium sp. CBMA 213]
MIARRADWVPLIPVRYRRPIMILLASTPFVAGVDFLMGENPDTMTIVERSMPDYAWGTLLVVSGLLSVGGYLSRRPGLCIAGLHLSGCIFGALSAGIAWASIDETGGFRGPWLYLVIAAASWLAALGYADQLKGGRR